jgi:hypothetical protein
MANVLATVDGCTTHTTNKYEECTTCNVAGGWYLDATSKTCKKCTAGGCTCDAATPAVCTGCVNTLH